MSAAIRLARTDEAQALSALKRTTFRETFLEGFAIPYPPADVAAYDAATLSPAAVAADLTNPALATWVAEGADGVLLGYARAGPCKLPHPDVGAHDGELHQLYIRRARQGAGLGVRLMQAAMDHLAAAHPGPVWLGVWSGNARAQAFYAARAFEKVGEYRFPVGSWEDHEFIMRRG